MQYQLVVQFPEKLIGLDHLCKIEDDLANISSDNKIDGHDIGSGEANIFILTNNPEYSFQNLKSYLVDKELLSFVKV